MLGSRWTKSVWGWSERGACRNVGPDLFFSKSGSRDTNHMRLAARVCEGCPVWRECRFVGLGEGAGVWGGLGGNARRAARGALNIAPTSTDTWEVMTEALDTARGDLDRAIEALGLDGQPIFERFDGRAVPRRRGVA